MTFAERFAFGTAKLTRNLLSRLLSGTDENNNDWGLPTRITNPEDISGGGGGGAFPENEEIVALESATDTTGGRTSADIVNRYGRNAVLFLNLTEIVGTHASLENLFFEAKMFDDYVLIGAINPSVDVAGKYLYTAEQCPKLPRTYRIRTITQANSGESIAYSVNVVHLL